LHNNCTYCTIIAHFYESTTAKEDRGVEYVKDKGKITNKEYQTLNSISERTASRDLSDLTDKRVLKSSDVHNNPKLSTYNKLKVKS
jgi:predicted HTH transcriptional regulator